MASALKLNASSTIINGAGLTPSPRLVSGLAQYQALPTIAIMSATFANAAADSIVTTSLGNIGNNVTKGHYLIDSYPSNVAPVCSGSIYYYGTIVTAIPDGGDPPGYTYTYDPLVGTEGFSHTVGNQAALPFNGSSPTDKLQRFANVYQTSFGFASSAFDTISSITMLTNKTYKQSGIGFTNPQDLATGGLGQSAALMSNVVSHWGTMYDSANFSAFGNIYVFGQNLLNQGLGSFGNLSQKFTDAGLNIADITQPPTPVTITTQTETSIITTTSVGAVELPTVGITTTTTVPTGSSSAVVTAIYKTVTGPDLAAIVSASGIANTNISKLVTLNDYLDFNKVVSPDLISQLAAAGITNFDKLGAYFRSKLGQASFASWAAMSTFLNSLDIPTQTYTTTTASSAVLLPATISTLMAQTGTGSGPFNNPILSDYLGAAAGIPYTNSFSVVTANYSTVAKPIETAMIALQTAVTNYMIGGGILDISTVDVKVTALNSALNAIPVSNAHNAAQTEWYRMLNKLTVEVSCISKAGVTFGSASPAVLKGFAQNITSSASDKDQIQTYEIVTNLISNDAAGDVIRAAISESINQVKLLSVGIQSSNDPQPSQAITQAKAQNIPLSTYLSQNK